MVAWGHGVGVLYWDFEWGFSVDEFGACGVGPSGFLGWGSLYKHKRITPGKNGAFTIYACALFSLMSLLWFHFR